MDLRLSSRIPGEALEDTGVIRLQSPDLQAHTGDDLIAWIVQLAEWHCILIPLQLG